MRYLYVSTIESVEQRVPTVLAVVETCLSILIYCLIAIYFNTLYHVIPAIVVAPFFLLKTEYSIKWGLVTQKSFMNYVVSQGNALSHKLPNFSSPYGGIVVSVIFILYIAALTVLLHIIHVLSSFVIKALSFVFWTIKDPLSAIKAIPGNWYQQTFCVDFGFPPELLPGENVLNMVERALFFPPWVYAKEIYKDKRLNPAIKLILIFLWLPPLIFGYGASLIYRVSFKATSVFYFPLVWVAHLSSSDPRPIYEILKRFKDGEMEKVRRYVATAVALFLLLKFAVFAGLITVEAALGKLIASDVLKLILSENYWAWWIASVSIEVVSTFALLFFADAALSRSEGSHSWNELTVRRVAVGLVFVRSLTAVIIVLLIFYFSVRKAYPHVLMVLDKYFG